MDVDREIERVFRRVFDDNSIELRLTTSAPDIPGWDSLTHINLIIELEEEFDLRFTVDDLAGLKNVGEMAQMIKRKLNVNRP